MNARAVNMVGWWLPVFLMLAEDLAEEKKTVARMREVEDLRSDWRTHVQRHLVTSELTQATAADEGCDLKYFISKIQMMESSSLSFSFDRAISISISPAHHPQRYALAARFVLTNLVDRTCFSGATRHLAG